MTTKNPPSSLVVGLALFSMFFGSGNLIFPLLLGVQFNNLFFIAALGFVITAVLLPTIGFLAMIPADGRYEKLFHGILDTKYSRWFFFIVLLFWIPLGSGPRCVVLAHSSIALYFQRFPPVWLFGIFYLALVYFCVDRRRSLIEVLGRFLTPALLLVIFLMVVASYIQGGFSPSDLTPLSVFSISVIEGYYTQDLIAAIFFSSAVVGILKNTQLSQNAILKKTLAGGFIAVSLLAILYFLLMSASALHSSKLVGLSGDKLVAALAQVTLGPVLGSVSALAVLLACFTTEVALVLVFADFLKSQLWPSLDQKVVSMLTLTIIWSMSLLDFSGIMAVLAPAMQIIYPVLFLLVVRYLWINRTKFIER